MRERFQSDEFKTYAETYRTKENPRAEELFRSEEIFRAPEFSSSTSLSTRRTLRRKNMRRQRSMLASIISAVGTATGAVMIVAAVLLSATKIFLSSVSATTHSLQFDMTIEWADNGELTALLTAEDERYEQTLSDNESSYTLVFASLAPDTEYRLEIADGATVYFSGNYRTAPIEPLVPISESVTENSVSLSFDASLLPESGYTVSFNGALQLFTLSADTPELLFGGLMPDTTYIISVIDPETEDVLFLHSYTTLTPEPSAELFSWSTTEISIDMTILVSESDSMIATLHGAGNQWQAALQEGENALHFDGLSPNTEYVLEVKSDENVWLSRTFRTAAAVPSIAPIYETILPDSISLEFDGATLPDSYIMYLNDVASGSISAEQTVITWTELLPETAYHVSAVDSHGNTVFEKTYTTPPHEISVTEIASESTMMTLRVELLVEHAKTPLTVSLGGQSQILQDGVNVVEFTGLSPDAEYTFEVRGGGNIYFTQTYRTQPYEQKLFPLETILPESIELQFEESELAADQYLVKLDGTEIGSINAAQLNLLLSGLTPETSYRVTIEDNIGNTVFDKTYTTPPYEISVTETAWEATMTTLRVEITVEHADVPLTASLSGQSHVLQNGVNVIEFTGLSPSAVYAVYVRDEEGETYFFQTYRTQEYVQTLFPTEVFLSPNTIYLQFSEEDLTENGYEVYASSELYGRLSTSEPFIRLENLTPNTRYHISIPDGMGNLLLDEYYLTPYLIAEVSDVRCTPTSLSLNLYLDMPSGEATLMLTNANGDTEYKIFGPGEGGDVLFDGLTPMTDYTLTITDDRGTVHYTETFRTELSPELVSISGNELTLEFPWWQLEGAEGTVELFLNGASTGIFLPVENDAVTLSNLIPQTLYEVSAVANGVTWWQDSFTTSDIIIESSENVVGSTDLNVSFLVQNPQGEPLRVVLLMGDMEIAAQTFTETRDGQMSFTASFETIPNGLYTVRLLRESDSLTLWQSELVTAYSFIEVLGSPELSETENGNELWVLPVMPGETVEFRVTEKIPYFTAEEITVQCTATDGSGELIPMSESDANGTLFSFNVTEEMIGSIYEFRLYRTVNGVPYLIERLYWKCRLAAI